jgi:peroxiredoxin
MGQRANVEEGRTDVATLAAGDTAPDLSAPLADAEGTPHRLADVLAERPVVLGLYKSSCQASKTMFPFLERIHRRHGGRVAVFGLAQDSANITRSFARRLGLTFPILIEPEDYPLSRAFAITATPTVFVIRPGGEIAYETMGFFKGPVNALGDAVAAEAGAPADPLFTEADTEVPVFVPG